MNTIDLAIAVLDLLIADVPGTDTITGGGSSETFVFEADFGKAKITDGGVHWTGAKHDVIEFAKSEFANFNALLSHATFASTGTTILNGNDRLLIEGITSESAFLAAKTLGDFNFV